MGFFMFLACFQVSAQDVKVDDIINNYLKNTGGAENWKQVKSMKMTGKMSMQNMEFPLVIYRMPEKKQRIEASIQGKEIIQAYDGTDAWWINPFMSGPEAQPMPDEMASEMKEETFEDVFIDYKKKGHQAELEGKETIDGAETYKVKLTKKGGDIRYYFFETENYVPIMIRSTVKEGQAKGQNIDTMLSDYQEVEGFVIPHFMEVRMNGQAGQKIILEAITFNEKMDESMFAFPKKQ
ncbi:hypothetical protein D770_03085 [Flammeovirgaceae bacterium 311]|nr:hypothetical protein D770_03085 [Flammeovirgaceae bacterium 311]